MIVRWHKRLVELSPEPAASAITLRPYRDEADIAPWLALRTAAFAGLAAPGPAWTEREFRREFLSQAWWTPQRMILADANDGASLLGSMAIRPVRDPASGEPAESIHWLMVAPTAQRRGLGRLLLAAAERFVWNAGGRLITLETLSSWNAAMGLYAACGYVGQAF